VSKECSVVPLLYIFIISAT